MSNTIKIEEIVRLFFHNGVTFCIPHGIKNDALMNVYIYAKDLDKVKELLNDVHYNVIHKDDGNFIISIM